MERRIYLRLISELIAIIVTTLICFRPIKRILKGKGNIVHFCIITFYVMQVIPLWIKVFWGIDETLAIYPNMYVAMSDEMTGYFYSLFVVLVEGMFAFLSRTLPYKSHSLIDLKGIYNKVQTVRFLKVVLFFGMFVSVVAVFAAPNPEIYKEFSYFYTNRVDSLNVSRIYHYSVIAMANRIVLFCILLFYLLNKNSKLNIFVYIAIAIMTWINGKRTLFTFALIGILGIDFLNKKYRDNTFKFIAKILFFLVIVLGYFLIYIDLTGKGSTTNFLNLYSLYFARMSNVQTSIFDILNEHTMMDYWGQSMLYNFFFWIPRSIWETKPVIFSKYFTAYVMGYTTIDINWQFQVNIWTEYIANFGFWGILLGVLAIYVIARLSEKSNSSMVYYLGWIFTILYTMFGFESTVQHIGMLWGIFFVFSKIPKIKFRW